MLDVSCKKVDEWLQKTIVEAQKAAEAKPVWLIHLGVGNNTVYHLEELAYNNKDFWNPDNDGYFCRNEPIS